RTPGVEGHDLRAIRRRPRPARLELIEAKHRRAHLDLVSGHQDGVLHVAVVDERPAARAVDVPQAEHLALADDRAVAAGHAAPLDRRRRALAGAEEVVAT